MKESFGRSREFLVALVSNKSVPEIDVTGREGLINAVKLDPGHIYSSEY